MGPLSWQVWAAITVVWWSGSLGLALSDVAIRWTVLWMASGLVVVFVMGFLVLGPF